MIEFNHFRLSNGLKVFVHEDPDTHIAVINTLYDVGSKDESPDKTGFAHLFEHLMFGGSGNVSSFDEPLQKVGGDNNAFTSPDITNYYITLPANNLETGFWLESDRMLDLSFDPNVLEVQRKVVIEEFKQRYLNQPYGDVWLKLRPLAYKVHPYQWATIGKDISHIEEATMDDVRGFYSRYYNPSNAILVVAGNVKTSEVERLAMKWFEPIPAGKNQSRKLPIEPVQSELREEHVYSGVPLDSIYLTYHMPARTSDDYYSADLVSDVLGRGKSSRLYESLVRDNKTFNSISAYVTGSIDPGLLVISGKLNPGSSFEKGIDEIRSEISSLLETGPGSKELDKVKNQAESTLILGEIEVLSRAMSIAFGAVMGNPNLVNEEPSRIQSVTLESFRLNAENILRNENASVLYYHKEAINEN